MKKKLLYISVKNPFDNKYSGDRERAKKTLEYLSHHFNIDLICLGKKKINNIVPKKINIIFFDKNLLFRILSAFLCFFKSLPLQIGFFFSQEIKQYLELNSYKYDVIIFNTIRTSQYLPKNYSGIKYLDMIDLLSSNYYQTYKSLFILNPLRYIYFYEYQKTRDYEKKIQKKFHKIFLVSKKDLKLASRFINRKRLIHIPMGIETVKNVYSHNLKNNKIIFIGNLKYLPNKLACYEFINKILPNLIFDNKNLLFYIIGEINPLDKIKFEFGKYKKNIRVIGKTDKLELFIKNSFCAVCNTRVASGFQTKILTYMSYGIPVIASSNTLVDKKLINKKNILSFKNNLDFINLILKLKVDKELAEKLSKNSIKLVKNYFLWKKIFKKSQIC